jgi:uncharacterized membrane protein YjgN (DUF898 family)
MAGESAGQDSIAAQFSGRRRELFWLLLRGYLMMLPTLGVYRFWVATQKRRFYWHNTSLGGEPLEYTGNAIQLLLGFLFAVAFFLPVYVLFFYFSTQSAEVAVTGYGGLLVLLWFMTGYAAYRARDFRLSRTLWRGIRFDQRGSAWAYAARRFFWSLLVLATLGLAYPFMAADLWRYRTANSWFGDRRFGFAGSWCNLAGPFYRAYGLLALLGIATLAAVVASPTLSYGDGKLPGWPAWLALGAYGLCLLCGWQYWRARSVSRMLSATRIGEAALSVRVSTRTVLGQALGYGVAVLGLALFFLIIVGILFGGVISSGIEAGAVPNPEDLQRMLRTGWFDLALIALTYLAFLAGLAFCAEMVPGFGFWAAVARGTSLTGVESLDSVRAGREDPSLIGEGLADALNVGSY